MKQVWLAIMAYWCACQDGGDGYGGWFWDQATGLAKKFVHVSGEGVFPQPSLWRGGGECTW